MGPRICIVLPNLPTVSETVLQAGLPFLSVSALPPLTWSDLGTPQRLFKLLQALGIAPPWMRGRRPALRAAQRAG